MLLLLQFPYKRYIYIYIIKLDNANKQIFVPLFYDVYVTVSLEEALKICHVS